MSQIEYKLWYEPGKEGGCVGPVVEVETGGLGVVVMPRKQSKSSIGQFTGLNWWVPLKAKPVT